MDSNEFMFDIKVRTEKAADHIAGSILYEHFGEEMLEKTEERAALKEDIARIFQHMQPYFIKGFYQSLEGELINPDYKNTGNFYHECMANAILKMENGLTN